jgi:deoxyribonuclease V
MQQSPRIVRLFSGISAADKIRCAERFPERMSQLNLPIPDLPAELRALLNQIPRGRVTTYGDLAEALGDRHAARWVAEFLLDHPHAARCPCHRVVRLTGEVGGYVSRIVAEKAGRLEAEGIAVRDGRVDLEPFRFRQFRSSRPLAALKRVQEEMPARVKLEPFLHTPDCVAGVDVAYPQPQRAVGAYALVDVAGGALLWSTTLETEVAFPYISGYLAFRELPVLLQLVERARAEDRLADVVLVDGHGLLHHRHAGIATHLGIVANIPTIGVGKKLLCGQVNLQEMSPTEPRPILHDACLVGMALKAKASSRPIFVSPGQFMTVADAVRLVQLLFHGHRLPEPIYHADRLSRVRTLAD